MEVFDPASTRDYSGLESSLMLRPTVSRPVCLGINHPSGAYDQILLVSDAASLSISGALSDEMTGLYFVCAAGPYQSV
jgi:hypothetical protein